MQNDFQKEMQNRRRIRKRKIIIRKFIRVTTGITAFIIVGCLFMTKYGHKNVNKFHFHQNLSGNMVPNKKEYIGSEYIDNYYVIELYHTGLNRNMLYIAHRFEYTSGSSKYTNVFNNYFIAYDDNEKDYYDFVKVTPLLDFLEEYDLVNDGYNYEDMIEIYNMIRDNYEFEDVSTCYSSVDKNKTMVRKKVLI